MPLNMAKMQNHERRIEIIDAALRKADLFGDKKAWLDLGEGQSSTLLHVTELNALRDKETEGIRASRS